MLKPEEKAIYLFNRALKQAICLNIEPNKENAKFIALAELQASKEFIYDATLLDDLQSSDVSKTISYIQSVIGIIEKM